ncbi:MULTISPECIES: peptide chain release factor N(5)-glutamine methyltransferase [unclassified Sphingomonas]|uniref:peptide chain release factor N(5)-glutamine methyltransferase n=1 Tax=unclassified Sphingomonas TaxID=196159 RepID=UPI000E10B878|nr:MULTISPECIES: peptide chain release factor N(5)-glutamine methyltransferase [unclassified Sphingomonas]AXJ94963.1 peptide chain release factor N(5)-glutamine methyltransferase [Sphingomonas sp. FARSPH]
MSVAALRAALADAAARFTFSETPRLDAELLLAHALGIDRNALLLDMDRDVPASFLDLVARRERHEPIAYITGTRGFWTIDLMVGPGTLVPRADSETLLVAASMHFARRAPASVLDLGTGPGTLLLAALDAWPARGMGIDRSDAALGYARANATALGMADRAAFVRGDWAAAIEARFDLVLANPPYIGTDEPLPNEVRAHEPESALFAGTDGLDDYRSLAGQLPRLIAPGGCAAVEIGHMQAAAVAALFAAHGLDSAVHRDLGGRDRCLLVTPRPAA